jgi:signal transduction histidine kinase/DNA-binding response OmpR family regulator
MVRVRPRFLKDRVLLVLTVLVGVHLASSVVIGLLVILPSFTSLEWQKAMTDLSRCVDALEREQRHVLTLCGDWAVWDDTYRFVIDDNEDFISSNLVPETLEKTTGINLVFIVDREGRVKASILYTPSSDQAVRLRQFPETQWPLDHPLLQHADIDSEIHGLAMTEVGPLLVASRPIVTSQNQGPIHGTIIMGRLLADDLLANLQRDLHLTFAVRDLRSADLSAEERQLAGEEIAAGRRILSETDAHPQRGYALLRDVSGEPALLLVADLPRQIVTRGLMALRYSLSSSVLAAVILLGTVYWLMHRLVLKRVEALQRGVAVIDASGDLSLRVPADGADELAALGAKLNQMLEGAQNSEAALRQSRAAADAANQQKSRFLSNVSHEMRTPINGIMGFCDAILRCDSLETARQQVRIILRESNVLLMLINDLLDLSKIESGKLVLERTGVDLLQLLAELIQSAGVQARAKGLELVSDMAPDVHRRITSDPLRLRQILLNLISNAVKFTEHGEVRVTVRRHPADGPSCLRFTVRDTGIGIPEDRQESIFESFAQVDVSTTRKYGGTGLGLAIVRQLVGLLGGELGLDSAPGRGSTFWFVIPAEPAPEEEEETVGVRPADEWVEDDTTRPGRILFAEDYVTNQEVARLFLEEVGHEVTIVSNGREAVEACRRTTFDVILLDQQMPVMDGTEAATCIRRESTPNMSVPIVALTASADAETRAACRQAGMDDVVTKPIRRDALVAAVGRWVGQRPATAVVLERHPAAPQSPEGPLATAPIDLESAVREFGGREVFERVLTRFLAQVGGQLAGLRVALAQREREALRRRSHALKGGAATLEAHPLAEAAGRLEAASAGADLQMLQTFVEAIVLEVRRLTEYVQASSYPAGSVTYA